MFLDVYLRYLHDLLDEFKVMRYHGNGTESHFSDPITDSGNKHGYIVW